MLMYKNEGVFLVGHTDSPQLIPPDILIDAELLDCLRHGRKPRLRC